MTGALERAVFSEELARRPGLLQSVDPRAKVAVILVLLVAASMVRRLEVLAVLYGVTLLLASLSRLPLRDFCKRAWLGVPLFAGVVILPSLFLTPGTPVLGPIGAPPCFWP
jgi:cobalt/nickel transport system permease protein